MRTPPPPRVSSPPPFAPKPAATAQVAPPKPASSRTEYTVRLTAKMVDRVNAYLANVAEDARDGAIVQLLDVGLARQESSRAPGAGPAANDRFGLAFCQRLLRMIETEGAPATMEYLRTRIGEMEGAVKEANPSEARWVQFIRLAELLSADERVPEDRRTVAAGVSAQVKKPREA
jgi:hypothetical protein